MPGPRPVRGGGAAPVECTLETVPPDYTHASLPPSSPGQGLPVKSLGEIRTDSRANLLVPGGFGHAGGDESITGFGGGNTWHDDIADGPLTAGITFKDRSVVTLSARVVIGSPKFGPQLVNVSAWDDAALDCALKYRARLSIFRGTCYPAWFLTDEDPELQTRQGDKPRRIVTLSHGRTRRR